MPYPYYLRYKIQSRSDGGGVQSDVHDYAGFSIPRSASALACSAGPPAPPRSCHGRPTHQPSVSPAKERAPTLSSASGGRGKAPSRRRLALSPGLRRTVKKVEIPAQHEYEASASVCCCTYCCSTWLGCFWWVDGLVGVCVGGCGCVGGWVGEWVGRFVRG